MKKLISQTKNFLTGIKLTLNHNSKKRNRQFNQWEFLNQKIVLKSVPTTYVIGVTNICQLNCPLCITGLRKQDKTPKHMTWDLFVEIIEKIKDKAELVQLFKWGESLLHPRIIDMLEYCNRYDLNTEISSNLSLENIDEKLESIVKYRLKHLIVSFDGVTQEEYSRYRKGGNINLVIENIKKIQEFKQKYNSNYPKISLQFLKNKFTKDQIDILKENYKQFGGDDYYVCDMTTIFKDRNKETELAWLDEESINARKYCDIDVDMHGKCCSFLYSTMIIEQDGSIPPCCFSTNKKDDYSKWDNFKTINEMYNSKKFIEARKLFKNKETNHDLTCNDCTVFITYNEKKMAQKPFVSIIIPTYNREEMLSVTVDSFINQSYPKDRYEIIIVNNNSTDNTQEIINRFIEKSENIKTLFEPRQGVHFARNSAAKIAKGEILYYTDDDMIADENLLVNLVQVFIDNPDVASASGKILPKWEKKPPKWVTELCNNYLLSLNDMGKKTIIRDGDFCVFSCHQAMRRDVFFKSGGFNPENTQGEWLGDGETGLNIKIQNLGYKFAYVGTSVIYHMIPPSRMTQKYLNKRFANQGNCDSYTDYRKFNYTEQQLLDIIKSFRKEIIANKISAAKKRIIFDKRWHLDRAKVDYFKNRIKYNKRILSDGNFKDLVLKYDWLNE